MKPRNPKQEDCELWGEGATIGPMMGRHLGAEDIMVIRHPDGRVRVAWVQDERDAVQGLPHDATLWTTFWGGMLPTDVVVT